MSKRRTQVMNSAAFKAGCLALIDDVAEMRREIVITKRGLPLAKLVPISRQDEQAKHGFIAYQGDLISPAAGKWDAES